MVCKSGGDGYEMTPERKALRNCLLLAMKRLHKGSHEVYDWEAIIRFCKEGGVEPSPLRDSVNGNERD